MLKYSIEYGIQHWFLFHFTKLMNHLEYVGVIFNEVNGEKMHIANVKNNICQQTDLYNQVVYIVMLMKTSNC